MKTKLLFLSVIFALASTAQAAKVDVKNSKITWKGSKVVGATHTGHVKIKAADVKYQGGEPVSANVVIDMTSISNTDVKDPQWNAKLVGHLNSDDFFSTKTYKTATLKVDKIQKASDKFYVLHGSLTIKGKTEKIKVKANVESKGKNKVVKADFKFDRTKFNVKYGSGSFFTGLGDKMISDEIEISVLLNIKG